MNSQVSQNHRQSRKDIQFYFQQEELFDQMIGDLMKMKKNLKSFINLRKQNHLCPKCGNNQIQMSLEQEIDKKDAKQNKTVQELKKINKNCGIISNYFEQPFQVNPQKQNNRSKQSEQQEREISEKSSIIEQLRPYQRSRNLRKQFMDFFQQGKLTLLNSVKKEQQYAREQEIRQPAWNHLLAWNHLARPPKPRRPKQASISKQQSESTQKFKEEVQRQNRGKQDQNKNANTIVQNPQESFHDYKYSEDQNQNILAKQQYGLHFADNFKESQEIEVEQSSGQFMNSIQLILRNKCKIGYDQTYQQNQVSDYCSSRNQSPVKRNITYNRHTIAKKNHKQKSIVDFGLIEKQSSQHGSPNITIKAVKSAQSILQYPLRKEIQNNENYFKFNKKSQSIQSNEPNNNKEEIQSNQQFPAFKVSIISKVKNNSFLLAVPGKSKKKLTYSAIDNIYNFGKKLLELEIRGYGRTWVSFEKQSDRQYFCEYSK